MQTQIGDKVTITLPNGVRFPGVVVFDETSQPFTLRDGTNITVTRANVISLRAQREDPEEKYLYFSDETVMFGFKPQMHPRYSSVVGLDVTEDGTILDIQQIIDAQSEQYSAFLAKRSEERATVTDAASI